MAAIAITGASSFSGLWIAMALADAGHDVVGLCSRESLVAYEGTLAHRRLRRFPDLRLAFGLKAEDGSLASWISSKKFDVVIHHHHYMNDFRSPNYDLKRALELTITPLDSLTTAYAEAGVKGVIYSSTYFDTLPQEISPYGYSKGLVYRTLRGLADRKNLALTKVVIANPIGPLENDDRLIPNLLRASVAPGGRFQLKAPSATTYVIPVTILAKSYLDAVTALLADKAPPKYEPSLGRFENFDFAKTVLSELVAKRLKLEPCDLVLPSQETQGPTTDFVPANTACDWPSFWDFYTEIVEDEFHATGSWTL